MLSSHGNLKNVYGVKWQLTKFTDAQSHSILTIEEGECAPRFIIIFQKKNKFVTVFNSKWQYVGKYKEENNSQLSIYAKINEKVHLSNEDCTLGDPTIYVMKAMLMNVSSYKIEGDNLTLFYTLSDGKSGLMNFVISQK